MVINDQSTARIPGCWDRKPIERVPTASGSLILARWRSRTTIPSDTGHRHGHAATAEQNKGTWMKASCRWGWRRCVRWPTAGLWFWSEIWNVNFPVILCILQLWSETTLDRFYRAQQDDSWVKKCALGSFTLLVVWSRIRIMILHYCYTSLACLFFQLTDAILDNGNCIVRLFMSPEFGIPSNYKVKFFTKKTHKQEVITVKNGTEPIMSVSQTQNIWIVLETSWKSNQIGWVHVLHRLKKSNLISVHYWAGKKIQSTCEMIE